MIGLGHIDAGLPRISLWCWEIVLSWQYIFVDTTCSRCSYTSHGVTWTFVRRGRNSLETRMASHLWWDTAGL